jgi:hypothetical protein
MIWLHDYSSFSYIYILFDLFALQLTRKLVKFIRFTFSL